VFLHVEMIDSVSDMGTMQVEPSGTMKEGLNRESDESDDP
jgi:hypothetical protein